MKTLTSLLLLLLPLLAPAQNKVIYPLDRSLSVLKWTGHAEVGTYAPSGTLSIQQGQIVIENGSVAGATLTVDMKSMQQDNSDLLHHLKSEDFFDVERYPTSVIAIDKVENGSVSGTLTVKGKTAPFQSPVKVTSFGDRFTITGNVKLDRTRYGIVYNSSSFFSGLGNKAIGNFFEVEFILVGTGTIPAKYRS